MRTGSFLLALFVQPFWSGICYLTKLQKKCPTIIDCMVWAIIVSLIGIYWFPWGDNLTHFAIYYSDTIERFGKFSFTSSYFVYDWVIATIAKISGNYVWGFFFWSFASLSIYYCTTWSIFLRNGILQKYSLLFISLIIIIGVRELLDLSRNTTAILFMVSAINLLKTNRLLSIILFLFSSVIHSSVVAIIVSGLLLRVFKKVVVKGKTSMYICIFAILLSTISIPILTSYAPERVVSYLEGQWGSGTGVNSGFAYLITITNCIIIVLLTLTIINKSTSDIRKSNIFFFYLGSLLLTLFSWFIFILRERFMISTLIIGVVLIITQWKYIFPDTQIRLKFIKCLNMVVLFCIIRFVLILGQTVSANFIFRNSAKDPYRAADIVSHSFILPTFLLIDIDNYGFNDKEFLSNYKRVSDTIER